MTNYLSLYVFFAFLVHQEFTFTSFLVYTILIFEFGSSSGLCSTTIISTSDDYFFVSYTFLQTGALPLSTASAGGHTKTVQRLLEAGAIVNHQNEVVIMFYCMCIC